MAANTSKAKRVWKSLMAYYGARLAENYGPQPPEEWVELIERCDSEQLERAMSIVRREHVNFPPTLGQFEAACRKPLRTGRQQTQAERLAEWIVANRRLTPTQLRGPWKWLVNSDRVITGVVIPADGDSPGHRVMVEDMQLGSAA